MKSIRKTVILNVFVLIVITLGVVVGIVYTTTVRSIEEKRVALANLVELKYEDNRDDELRKRADNLAGDVQSDFSRTGFRNHWIALQLAAITAPLVPSGPMPWVVSSVTVFPNPVAIHLNARMNTELKLNEEDMYHGAFNPAQEYVQISGEWGSMWTSKSLSGYSLPLNEAELKRDSESKARFDTIRLPHGQIVRRVIVTAPVTRFSRSGNFWIPRSPRVDDTLPVSRAIVGVAGAARTPRPFGPPPGTVVGPPANPPVDPRTDILGVALPHMHVQCAWEIGNDHPRLQELNNKRDEELRRIDEETAATIQRFRNALAWTVAGAVAVTLLGGWFLVGLGLSPLKRLTTAVSEISPKDFRLPLDPKGLPREVNPVAERLSQALAQLHSAFEREKRAAADISHELRTPLAALTTTIEVACRKTRTAEQYRQTLDECREIARQMSQLVERMLMLAWIDAGADVMRPEAVEVCDLVGGVAAIAKPLAEVQGLTLKVSIPSRLTIRTDPDKLREVVMNLTHNAIEYNRPGGEVELSATQAAQGGVTLEVRDTGIGMSPEIQGKIFERFYRADPSRQATSVHAGLGLAIVKEYVDRLGGRLTVDSIVGSGSRFRIDLPNAL